MRDPIDLHRIARLADRLEAQDPNGALEMLRTAVIFHGGRWDLPSDKPGVYDPAVVSIQVHGVYAMAEDTEDLPANWCRAARNILCALGEGDQDDAPDKGDAHARQFSDFSSGAD